MSMEKQTQINGILSPLLQRIRINKALPHINGKKILDIGCSNGEMLKYLSQDIDYVGVEGSNSYFNKASETYPNHKFINLYIDGDNAASLDIGKQDTIIMLAVLEHMKFPAKILKNLKKYLAENGRIVITTPSNFSEYILKIGSKFRIFSSEMDEHENHFSKKNLMSICVSADLNILYYSRFEIGMNHLVVLEKRR